jgi:transcriptional regulator with XRE-family HTH domain
VTVISEWDGSAARALRKALRMSQERFAENLGVGVRTVRDWEAAGLRLTPVVAHQEALDTVLERASDEQQRRFEALYRYDSTRLTSEAAQPQPDEPLVNRLMAHREALNTALERTSDGQQRRLEALYRDDSTRLTSEASHRQPDESLVRPRTRVVKNTSFRRLVGQEHRVDVGLVTGIEDFTDALARVNGSIRSEVLIGSVISHANLVLRWLDRPMSEQNRWRLNVVAVESHTQAGMLAFLSSDRTAAGRYFALAQSVAAESGNPTLVAQILAASSVLHSSIPQGGQGGNPRRAVALLTAAVNHARSSDSPTRAWIHRWLALELAAAGDERGFRVQMEQAEQQRTPAAPRRGYFARSGGFEQIHASETAGSIGIGLVFLGHADEAIDALRAASTSEYPRREVIVLADTAAAHFLQGEPEQAVDSLLHAHDLALKAGYWKGLERIRGIRFRASRRYSHLPCMRTLDHRLRRRK